MDIIMIEYTRTFRRSSGLFCLAYHDDQKRHTRDVKGIMIHE